MTNRRKARISKDRELARAFVGRVKKRRARRKLEKQGRKNARRGK